MNTPKVLFLGSPEEVICCLDKLHKLHQQKSIELMAVISQPDKPAKRRKKLISTPVSEHAKKLGLDLYTPEKVSHANFLEIMKTWDVDIAITAAYGQILSDEFLKIPRRATINIHPSLLPKYRGATPVQSALLNGDIKTGVSILFTVKQLDAGNIILREPFSIPSDACTPKLLSQLFELGASQLEKSFDLLSENDFIGQPQESFPEDLTHCKKINKQDGLIDWQKPAIKLYNEFRAYNGWPGSYTFFEELQIQILDCKPGKIKSADLPGHFQFIDGKILVSCGQNKETLAVTQIKKAGGKPMDAKSFINGLGQRPLVFSSPSTEQT